MNKFKKLMAKRAERTMANFALAFAGGSVQRICFYIFHQPKMPESVMKLKEK